MMTKRSRLWGASPLAPMAAGGIQNEQYPDTEPNSIQTVAEEPGSTFSIDVDTAAYANTRRSWNPARFRLGDAVRIEALVNHFDDDCAQPDGADAVERRPRLMHIGIQGPRPGRRGRTAVGPSLSTSRAR